MIVINVLCDYAQILIPSVVAEGNRLPVLPLLLGKTDQSCCFSDQRQTLRRSSDVSRVQYNIFTGPTMTE